MGRYYLLADPFDFDRVEHPWRVKDRALTLADVVGDHTPAAASSSKGKASKASAAAAEEEERARLRWLSEELRVLLEGGDEAKLASRPLAPRLAVQRALLLLLETVFARADDVFAAPVRKLARDVHHSLALSLAADLRALHHVRRLILLVPASLTPRARSCATRSPRCNSSPKPRRLRSRSFLRDWWRLGVSCMRTHMRRRFGVRVRRR